MGKPDKDSQGQFTRFELDDITVWKAADIEAGEEDGSIRIGLVQMLFFKTLSIDGARIAAPVGEK